MSFRVRACAARAGILVVALALGPALARAQNGRVVGVVVDQDTRDPIEDAKVVLRHTTMGTSFKATTNDKGSYRIGNVRFGDYDVSVEKEGYYSYKGTFSVEPRTNDATTINVQLKASPKQEKPKT